MPSQKYLLLKEKMADTGRAQHASNKLCMKMNPTESKTHNLIVGYVYVVPYLHGSHVCIVMVIFPSNCGSFQYLQLITTDPLPKSFQ